MTCLASAWRSNLGWVSALATLALTWGGLWTAGWSLEQGQPVTSKILTVEVLQARTDAVARTLRVEFTTPHPGNCIRFAIEGLYQETAGVPVYYPLGTALNGSGFAGRNGATFGTRTQVSQPLNFVVMLALPSTIPDGLYQFVYRSLYTCSWLGGFVVRRIQYEAPPVPVWVGAH